MISAPVFIPNGGSVFKLNFIKEVTCLTERSSTQYKDGENVMEEKAGVVLSPLGLSPCSDLHLHLSGSPLCLTEPVGDGVVAGPVHTVVGTRK